MIYARSPSLCTVMRKAEYSVALYIDMKHHLVLSKGVITFAHMASAYWLTFLLNK